MKISAKAILLILLVLEITGSAFAKTTGKQSSVSIPAIMDSLLYSPENGLVSNKSVIGASIGIYWKGKTYYYSYGLADKERNLKADTNTLYEIGSNTKVFTGLMLSSEMADGKMSGNDFIDQYVEVNKNIRHKVKLTDIANHISGLPTFHDSASLAELIAKDTSKDPLMMITDDYTLSVLKKVDTLHDYGKYEYSNLGVGLLGYILQQKEHASYAELLQRMICKPLGLQHTTADADSNASNLARGYYRRNRAPFISLCPIMQGAGAIKSNVVDMTSFIKAQLTGNARMQKALDIDHKTYYNGEILHIAMGWHIAKMYNTPIYEMRGDTYGASSLIMFAKEQDLGIVVLLNSANSGVVENIQQRILSKLLDTTSSEDRYKLPEIMVDKKTLDHYTGVYELQPGFDATVTVADGKLALQLTGQPSLPFKAVDQNWFVLEKYGCQLEFARDDKGHCSHFYLYQNGEKIECKRK